MKAYRTAVQHCEPTKYIIVITMLPPHVRVVLPHTTGVYNNPLGRSSMLDISTAAGTLSVPKKVGIGKSISPSEGFPKTYRFFGYWHPLRCREIKLGKNAPGACDASRLIASPRLKRHTSSYRITRRTHTPPQQTGLLRLADAA